MISVESAQPSILQIAAANAWAEISSPAANMKKTKAGKTAFAAVALSLTLLCLFLATMLPTNKLFFLGGSSIFTSLVLLECGPGWAWLFYFAASALALWLLPMGPASIAYVLFFGTWGLLRESLSKRPQFIALIFKLCYFNLLLFVLYWVAKRMGFNLVVARPHFILPLWLGSQVGMLLFDWAFGLFLAWYRARFQTK